MRISSLALVVAVVALPSRAATITVTTTADEANADGDCSLREAVSAANGDSAADACAAGSGVDVIVVPAGSYDVGVDVVVSDDVVVDGDGSVFVLGAAGFVVDNCAAEFDDVAFAGGTVGAVEGRNAAVTLRRARFTDNVGGSVSMLFPNAAGDVPRLVVEDSQLENASGAPAINTARGDVRISDSTFVGNDDGALVVNGDVGDDVDVVNSTFDSNHRDGDGGAIAAFIGGTIRHATILGNSTDGNGGGIFAFGALTISDSVVVGNAAVAGNACFDPNGTTNGIGVNMIDDVVGDCFLSGNDVGTGFLPDDLFAPLADNGGFTDTRIPFLDKPTIDGAVCPAGDRDQRGAERDPACDIGAVDHAARFLDVVVRVVPEAAGANCARGGNAVEFGADDGGGDVSFAGDGVLGDAEVDQRVFVCEQAAAPVLVDVDADDGTCANGGIIVRSGADDDGDGVLDVGERDAADHVCNGEDGADGVDGEDGVDGDDGAQGAPGTPGQDGDEGPAGEDGTDGQNGGAGVSSLIRTAVVNAGDSGCNAGGQKIEAGVDDGANGGTAGNGILDDGEVDSTAVVCNGEAFEDEFEASGGPTCASFGSTAGLPFAVLLVLLRRRRR